MLRKFSPSFRILRPCLYSLIISPTKVAITQLNLRQNFIQYAYPLYQNTIKDYSNTNKWGKMILIENLTQLYLQKKNTKQKHKFSLDL